MAARLPAGSVEQALLADWAQELEQVQFGQIVGQLNLTRFPFSDGIRISRHDR